MSAIVKPVRDGRYLVVCDPCGWGRPSSGTYARVETAQRNADEHNAAAHPEPPSHEPHVSGREDER